MTEIITRFILEIISAASDIAQAYQELKLSLWKKFEHNRDAYTDAKTDFINHYVSEAKSSNFQESEKCHQKNS